MQKQPARNVTNVFEIALHETYKKLGLGEPEKNVVEVFEQASVQITAEVKKSLNKRHSDFVKEKKRISKAINK
jgi:hypothetical protein